MSVHSDKIESVLRRAIQDVLGRGLHDPRVRGMVSVTRLNLSPDLANATVFVSVIPREHESLTMHGFKAAETWVRGQVARRVSLRRMPNLTFKLDHSLKKEADVLQALRDDEESLRRIAESAPSSTTENEDEDS